MEVEMEQTNQFRENHQSKSTVEEFQLDEVEQLRAASCELESISCLLMAQGS
jgi:hypothetical protein